LELERTNAVHVAEVAADKRLNHVIKGRCGSAINAISTFRHLLEPFLNKPLPPEMEEMLLTPMSHLREAVEWFHRRQVFVQLERGQYVSRCSPVDLNAFLTQTLCGAGVLDAGLDRHLAVDTTVLKLAMDEVMSNALKYRRNGTDVRVSANLEEGHVHVRVTNKNCVGFKALDEEECRRVFLPGYKSHVASATSDGVGLETVSRAMTVANGSVRLLCDTEAETTTVHLSLPAIDIPSQELSNAALPPEASLVSPATQKSPCFSIYPTQMMNSEALPTSTSRPSPPDTRRRTICEDAQAMGAELHETVDCAQQPQRTELPATPFLISPIDRRRRSLSAPTFRFALSMQSCKPSPNVTFSSKCSPNTRGRSNGKLWRRNAAEVEEQKSMTIASGSLSIDTSRGSMPSDHSSNDDTSPLASGAPRSNEIVEALLDAERDDGCTSASGCDPKYALRGAMAPCELVDKRSAFAPDSPGGHSSSGSSAMTLEALPRAITLASTGPLLRVEKAEAAIPFTRRPVTRKMFCIGIDDEDLPRLVHNILITHYLDADEASCSIGRTREERNAFVDVVLGLRLPDLSYPDGEAVPADVVLLDENIDEHGDPPLVGSLLCAELRMCGFRGITVVLSGAPAEQIAHLRCMPGVDLAYDKSTGLPVIAAAITRLYEQRCKVAS